MNKKSNRNDEKIKVTYRFISPKEVKELDIDLKKDEDRLYSKSCLNVDKK